MHKVKAHQDRSAVALGLISEADWVGNQIADACAFDGAISGRWEVRGFCEILRLRRQALDGIIAAVQGMIVRVLQHASPSVRTASLLRRRQKKPCALALPTLPDFQAASRLRRHTRELGTSAGAGTWRHALARFVLESEWQQVPEGQGMPIFLLLVAFEKSTGMRVCAVNMLAVFSA